MPRGIPNCDLCHKPMKRERGGWHCQNGCWGCGCCGEFLRKGEVCGCWVCRCCERYAEDVAFFNVAGSPCSQCGHDKGACDCVECVRHCGFLHPVGYVCEPPTYSDDDVPF
jgi:hypothetical protein